MAKQILMAWSGGKDSTMALDLLVENSDWEVAGLLTTLTLPYDRVSMHGVRRSLLFEQARCLELPLEIVWLEAGDSNDAYEARMDEKLREMVERGVWHVAFGDIFLEEIRLYREKNLARLGMKGLFPLWGMDTRQAIRNFVNKGFKAIITCVDTKALDGSFLGRTVDESLLSELPPGIDPCGENGEFHSFVYDGPLFKRPVGFCLGEVVEREGGRFMFQDLLPQGWPNPHH